MASDVVRSDLYCNGCKKDREKRGERPLYLMKLPKEIAKHAEFKDHNIPIYLCVKCDGDALENAMDAHTNRLGGGTRADQDDN